MAIGGDFKPGTAILLTILAVAMTALGVAVKQASTPPEAGYMDESGPPDYPDEAEDEQDP